jgi:hypothetical protein
MPTIEKRQVVTGRVRVQTVTDTGEELAHANVQRETLEVIRVPIDKWSRPHPRSEPKAM